MLKRIKRREISLEDMLIPGRKPKWKISSHQKVLQTLCVQFYLNKFEQIHRIVHIPTFEKECPATGGLGGVGVMVAVAMGARVIAMGRNEKELERLREHVKRGTPNSNI